MATLKTTTLEGSLTGVVNGRPSIYISRNVRRNNTDNSSGDVWFKFAAVPATGNNNGPLLYLTFSGGPTSYNLKTVQKIIVGTRAGFSASIVDEVLNGSSSSSYTNSSIQIYQETDGSYSLYIKLLGNTYSGGQVIVQDGSWSSWTPGNFPQYFDIIDGSPSHTSTPSGTLVFDGSSASERGLIIKDYVNDNVGIGGISAPLNTLHIHGSNAGGAANLGPKLGFTTTNDAYHLFQIFPYAHDNISLLFDSYYNSGWFSSDAGSNFAIYKYGDLLRLRYDSGIAQGSAITWNDGLVMDVNGNIGIGTTNPVSKLQIGNGTSNSYSTVAQLSGDSGGASILSALSLVNSRGAALSNGVSIDFHTANNYSSTGKIATVQAGATTTDSELRFYTYNSGLNQRMVLNYLGNVGIGTASPAYKLEVVGDMRVSGGIVDAGSSAQWTLNGGGTVTWNGSYILWETRVIAIPVEKIEFSTAGYLDITCPTSGTITYYNSSNVTTTVTCTANGIPIGIWEALYYEITPGQSQTSDQTKFRLVAYQNSTWRPSSNWILICTRNGDSTNGHLKWIPGQINIPNAGGIYYSGTGLNNWESNGTTNYISKFTSANVLGDSTIYDNGTNVGIGTASPASLVHLYKASGDSILTIDNTGNGNTSGIDFNRQRLSGPGVNGASIFLDSDTSTNNAFLYIQAQSTSAQAGVTSALGANNGVRLLLRGNTGQFSIENGASESFRIDASGNVGVGTAIPTQKLHTYFAGDNGVKIESLDNNSSLYIKSATSAAGFIRFEDGSNRYYISVDSNDNMYFRPQATSDTTKYITFDSVGNVGIGITTPSSKLHVVGTIISADTSTSGKIQFGTDSSLTSLYRDNTYDLVLHQGISSNNGLYLASAGSVYVNIDSNNNDSDKIFAITTNALKGGSELFRVQENGNVGIGTPSPSYKLDVSGTTNVSDYLTLGKDIGFPISSTSAYFGYATSVSSTGGSLLELAHALSSGIGVNDPIRFRSIITNEESTDGTTFTTESSPPTYANLLSGNTSLTTFIISYAEYSSGIRYKRFVVDLGGSYVRPNFILIQSMWGDNAYYGFDILIEKSVDNSSWTTACSTQTQANGYARVLGFNLGDLGSNRYLRFTIGATQAITSGGNLRFASIRSITTQPGSTVNPIYTDTSGNLNLTKYLIFANGGGGWYMSDTSWIRSYGNKSIYHNTGILRTDGTFHVGNNGISFYANSSAVIVNDGASGTLDFRVEGQTDPYLLFTDASVNRVGIGTSSPAYTLDVNGTIHYTSLTASSDARFKTNVQPIENALQKISNVRGVKFEWNTFINNRRNGYELNKPTFGVLAQELEAQFPELVTTWNLSEDCPDARSVNYEKIIPVLIEAIKELKTKNEILENRITILENQ